MLGYFSLSEIRRFFLILAGNGPVFTPLGLLNSPGTKRANFSIPVQRKGLRLDWSHLWRKPEELALAANQSRRSFPPILYACAQRYFSVEPGIQGPERTSYQQ